MSRPPSPPADLPPPSPKLSEGWHCLHLYYQVDTAAWEKLSPEARSLGVETVAHLLDPERPGAPPRLQTSVVSGHKADLAVMVMDPDPLLINGVRQGIRASAIGSVLVPVYSFVSITEVSEYVPTVEQYAARLALDGMGPDHPSHAARVQAYEQRLSEVLSDAADSANQKPEVARQSAITK